MLAILRSIPKRPVFGTVQLPALQRASQLPFAHFRSYGLSSTLSTRTARYRLQSRPTATWRQSGGSRTRVRGARCNSTEGPASQTAREKITERSQGISARLKELSRKYGWAAFGVYMGLSALDFPFCFLAVRLVGTERIEAVERVVVHAFWNIVAKVYPSAAPVQTEPAKDVIDLSAQDEAAKKSSHHGATLGTQLLLAYGVHKSLIFFRVPLAAAVTPKVVKWLRARGWNIGKPKPTVG